MIILENLLQHRWQGNSKLILEAVLFCKTRHFTALSIRIESEFCLSDVRQLQICNKIGNYMIHYLYRFQHYLFYYLFQRLYKLMICNQNWQVWRMFPFRVYVVCNIIENQQIFLLFFLFGERIWKKIGEFGAYIFPFWKHNFEECSLGICWNANCWATITNINNTNTRWVIGSKLFFVVRKINTVRKSRDRKTTKKCSKFIRKMSMCDPTKKSNW